VRCRRCKEFGHFSKTCQMPVVGEDGESSTPKKRYTAVLIHVLLMTTNLKILNSLPCVHCRKRQVAEDIAGPSQKNKKKISPRERRPQRKRRPQPRKSKSKLKLHLLPVLSGV